MTPKVELEDLVTAAEIGRRLGVSRQRAAQLAERDDFPAPIGRLGNYTVYKWKPVEKWASKRGLNGRAAGQLRQEPLSIASGDYVFVTNEREPGVVFVQTLDGKDAGAAVAWHGTPIVDLRPHPSGVTVVGGRYEGEITRNAKGNWTLSSARDRR